MSSLVVECCVEAFVKVKKLAFIHPLYLQNVDAMALSLVEEQLNESHPVVEFTDVEFAIVVLTANIKDYLIADDFDESAF